MSELVFETESRSDRLCFRLVGRLDANSLGRAWDPSLEARERARPALLEIDCSGLDYCDGAGLALFDELRRRQAEDGHRVELTGLDERLAALVELLPEPESPSGPAKPQSPHRIPEDVGRVTLEVVDDALELLAFIGELALGLLSVLRRPASLRYRDVWLVTETAGANALPIVAMIGFLIGLIMAFQSAIPLRQFGAEIFVANLVSLSILRELGPFVTAIILAGRSGSAFAAEIGTMTVNEEIDALRTMGVEPMKFLVLPRVIAAVIVTPMLTLFFNLFGLIGGALVMRSLGFPLVTYVNQVLYACGLSDLLGGLLKAFAFGVLVAGIGCLRGLQTGRGASAVGDSTTRAVVSGIILIAIFDSIFSVIFFALGV